MSPRALWSIPALALLLAPAGALAADAAKDKADIKAAFSKLVSKYEDARKTYPIDKKVCTGLAEEFADWGRKNKVADAIANGGSLYNTCGGDSKKAEGLWREALQLAPENGTAHAGLGQLAYLAGQPQTAEAEFQAALKVGQNVSAWNNLSLMMFEKARANGNDRVVLAEAIKNLRRSLAVDGDSMPAYGLMAQIYYTVAESDRSKLDLAALVCKQAKEVNPNYAPIYNINGLINLKKKNVTGALGEFRKAAELEPQYVEAQLNIGAITLSARDYVSAEKAFRAALDAKPKNPQELFDATMGMGVSARGQNRIDEALDWYQKAKAIDAKNCAVLYNSGVIWHDYIDKEDHSNMNKAKEIFNDFLACGQAPADKLADAKRRIKDVDDFWKALAEAKKMEEEAKKAQEEAAKQMEEARKAFCKSWKEQIVPDAIKNKQPVPAPSAFGDFTCDPIPGVWPPPGQPAPAPNAPAPSPTPAPAPAK